MTDAPRNTARTCAAHDRPTAASQMDLVAAAPAPDRKHPVRIYVGQLAPGWRRTMGDALDVIAGILSGGRCDAMGLDWGRLRFRHTQGVRAALAERYPGVATANKMLSALRGVLRAAWKLGRMDAQEYQAAVDFKNLRGKSPLAGRALSGDEPGRLFRACAADDSPARSRDAALLAILFGGGLRRAEAAALEASDYDAATGALNVRQGKGRKPRTMHARGGARDALAAWLRVRGAEPGALFCPLRMGGHVVVARMPEQAVYSIVRGRAEQAGVASISPHDFRRSFVTALLDAGADLAVVARMAGHASVVTTARYDRRGEDAEVRAANLLKVPYLRK